MPKTIDLSKATDEQITHEYFRRVRARRDASKPGGRPKKLGPCPACGDMFGVTELRAHKPQCIRAPGTEGDK